MEIIERRTCFVIVVTAGDEDEYVDIEGEDGIMGFNQQQLFTDEQNYGTENENSEQYTEYDQSQEGESYVQYGEQHEGEQFFDPSVYDGEFQTQEGFEGNTIFD